MLNAINWAGLSKITAFTFIHPLGSKQREVAKGYLAQQYLYNTADVGQKQSFRNCQCGDDRLGHSTKPKKKLRRVRIRMKLYFFLYFWHFLPTQHKKAKPHCALKGAAQSSPSMGSSLGYRVVPDRRHLNTNPSVKKWGKMRFRLERKKETFKKQEYTLNQSQFFST